MQLYVHNLEIDNVRKRLETRREKPHGLCQKVAFNEIQYTDSLILWERDKRNNTKRLCLTLTLIALQFYIYCIYIWHRYPTGITFNSSPTYIQCVYSLFIANTGHWSDHNQLVSFLTNGSHSKNNPKNVNNTSTLLIISFSLLQ